MTIRSFRIAYSNCPDCSRSVNGALPVGDNAPPQPGDIALCAYCGGLSLYDNDLRLRQPTIDEMDELVLDEHLMFMWQQTRHYVRHHRN